MCVDQYITLAVHTADKVKRPMFVRIFRILLRRRRGLRRDGGGVAPRRSHTQRTPQEVPAGPLIRAAFIIFFSVIAGGRRFMCTRIRRPRARARVSPVPASLLVFRPNVTPSPCAPPPTSPRETARPPEKPRCGPSGFVPSAAPVVVVVPRIAAHVPLTEL